MEFEDVLVMEVDAEGEDELDVAIWNTLCKARYSHAVSAAMETCGDEEDDEDA